MALLLTSGAVQRCHADIGPLVEAAMWTATEPLHPGLPPLVRPKSNKSNKSCRIPYFTLFGNYK
jgi:hypothetical protein